MSSQTATSKFIPTLPAHKVFAEQLKKFLDGIQKDNNYKDIYQYNQTKTDYFDDGSVRLTLKSNRDNTKVRKGTTLEEKYAEFKEFLQQLFEDRYKLIWAKNSAGESNTKVDFDPLQPSAPSSRQPTPSASATSASAPSSRQPTPSSAPPAIANPSPTTTPQPSQPTSRQPSVQQPPTRANSPSPPASANATPAPTQPPSPTTANIASAFASYAPPALATTTPAVPVSITSPQLGVPLDELRSAFGKLQSGFDTQLSLSEFRELVKKHPNLANLVRKSAEESITRRGQSADQLRDSVAKFIQLDNNIQQTVFSSQDGEIPLKIRYRKPVPLQFQIIDRVWIRKPVGL